MIFHMILNGWPHTECFPYVLHGWPHTVGFSKRTTWMAPYRIFSIHMYMDGPIQNDFPDVLNGWPHTECFPNVLNGWPHTECFSKHTKWMAPYRMFSHTYYMDGPIQNE